jgi:membrane-associated phospholipid phosphatase
MHLLLQSAEKRAAPPEDAGRGTAPSPRFSAPLERLLVAACLALLALAVFLAYTFDDPLLRLLHRATNFENAVFWRGISWFGSGLVLTPAVAAIVLVLAWRNETRSALALAFGWAATSLTVEWLKWLLDRGRPPVTPWTLARGDAFPSGHAALSLYLSLYIALSLLGSVSSVPSPGSLGRSLRSASLLLLASIPVVVGLSRVTLGVHWPSDVAAGWAVGLFFCALARVIQAADRDA